MYFRVRNGLSALILFVAIMISGLANAGHDQHLILELVHKALADKINFGEINTDIEFEQTPDLLKIIKNQHQINYVELLDFSMEKNRAQQEINIMFHMEDASPIKVSAKVSISKEFAATAKSINRNEIVNENFLQSVSVNLSKFSFADYLTKDEVIGMQARRKLPSGILIKKQDLFNPIIIKTNDMVNIVYEGQNFKLQSSGVSLGDGAVGDTIKLKVGDSNKNILVGKILDKDTVLINAKN
jgi:flagella basal body P-ring formation protein FlgA